MIGSLYCGTSSGVRSARSLCRGSLSFPPQPAQRIRQDRPAVLAIVPLRAHLVLVVVFLEFQRQSHLLVGQRPVAVLVIQVFLASLEENADRFRRGLANSTRIDVAAANIREAADVR